MDITQADPMSPISVRAELAPATVSHSPITEAVPRPPISVLPEATAPAPLARIKAGMQRDKVIRLALEFMGRFSDAHLKFLSIDSMDDQRRMRVSGREMWNFGSDSFLGLDRDARVQRAIVEALPRWGAHNGASRAFTSIALYEDAERRLAKWLGVPDTLIFPSVTLANAGLLPALTGPKALLVVDRHAHDSVHQGVQLAEARGAVVRELTPCRADVLGRLLDGERFERALVATDGVYSMTGDMPPLADLDRAARARGALLYVDDAHGTAVVGPRGRGAACAALGALDNVLMVGSLSKGFSCLGAFVTCDPQLKLMLRIRANTLIFGGPVPPPYLAAICAACDIIDSPEGDNLRTRLQALIDRTSAGIRSLGLKVIGGDTPIVSVVLGEIETALEAGKWLFDRGFYVQSAHYPAVPINGSLLRIQVNANHPTEAIDALLNAFADLTKSFNLPVCNGRAEKRHQP